MMLPLPLGEGWGEGILCDGSQHYTEEGLEADRVRDDALAQLGLRVVRFDNGHVLEEIDCVVEQICKKLKL